MNNKISGKILIWVAALALATSSAGAFANNRDQSTLIGGVIGAFAGAVVGQQVGGRNGVLPGVLIGAAAGVAIGSSANNSRRDDSRRAYYREPVRYAPPVRYVSQPVRYVPPRPIYYGNRDRGYSHRDVRGGRGYQGHRGYR